MAHWGVAMTLFQPLWPTRPGPAALQRGWEEVQQAKALQPRAERDRLFVAGTEAFFLEPANLRRYTMEFRGHRRDMVEFLHAGYRIWGVTAAILLNLLKRMGHPC